MPQKRKVKIDEQVKVPPAPPAPPPSKPVAVEVDLSLTKRRTLYDKVADFYDFVPDDNGCGLVVGDPYCVVTVYGRTYPNVSRHMLEELP